MCVCVSGDKIAQFQKLQEQMGQHQYKSKPKKKACKCTHICDVCRAVATFKGEFQVKHYVEIELKENGLGKWWKGLFGLCMFCLHMCVRPAV